jgi:CheY-like chemotaxis protein
MSSFLDLLIVEDEAETRLLMSQILRTRGYAVRTAQDGFEALSMIRTSIPDVLLSDLNMPGMSGFELLSVVRRLYPAIRVLAASGAYSGRLIPLGLAADGFYEKASGLAPLFESLEVVTKTEYALLCSRRVSTPLWVDLEPRTALESDHVLINCPQCMRAFRQNIDQVSTEIRSADCRCCGGRVRYAIAFAVKPMSAFKMSGTPLPGPSRSAIAASSHASL